MSLPSMVLHPFNNSRCFLVPENDYMQLLELKNRETSTDFQLGGIAMARSMKATLQLLREGRWTLEQAEQWVEEQLK